MWIQMSWKNNTCQYTAFTVFFTSSRVSVSTLGPSHIYHKLIVWKSQLFSPFFIRLFVFYCLIFIQTAHGGHTVWLVIWGVNFELKEVTAGFLRGTPGASVIQRDGGFLPDRGRMNGWNQILTAWVPRHATHCSVCYRLACTVYLPFPSLPLASLIVLHRRFVSCSKPLVVKPFCLSVFRSFLYNTPICCSVTPWAPRGQDLSGSAIPIIVFEWMALMSRFFLAN